MNKILVVSLIVTVMMSNAIAGSDEENSLSKKNEPVKDCYEGFNRLSFAINESLDNIIFEPIAKAYRVLPFPVRKGTSNALNNISNLVTIPNNIFQGEYNEARINTGRFLVNSTLGIVGIFDVAKQLGFTEYEKEDYGQTLGVMGFKPGCYLVLPVLGPSTIRDTVGSFANIIGGDPFYNISVARDTHHFSDFDYWGSKVGKGIDFRAKNIETINNLEKNSMDFYASIKSLYLQDRQQKIANSNLSAETMDDSDWEEIEDQ